MSVNMKHVIGTKSITCYRILADFSLLTMGRRKVSLINADYAHEFHDRLFQVKILQKFH